MNSYNTLLIQRNQVKSLLNIQECMDAVEHAFKLRARGKAAAPGILGVHTNEGGFHTKAGILTLNDHYFVSKTNANFPQNKKLHGLPTIQGIVMVSNADNGKLLALMDSIEITIIRTGAATGIAAKYLSRQDSKVVLICGCGNQGKISLNALLKVRPIEKVFAYDIDGSISSAFATEVGKEENIQINAITDLRKAAWESDIIVTCTPAKSFFIKRGFIKPGTFIAAIGADSEDKQEIDPELLRSSTVVVDSLDQCSSIGELHHALKLGIMKATDVHAELGEVAAGLKVARKSDDEIVIFDSTGTALQDVAAASIVFERALKQGIGSELNFAE